MTLWNKVTASCDRSLTEQCRCRKNSILIEAIKNYDLRRPCPNPLFADGANALNNYQNRRGTWDIVWFIPDVISSSSQSLEVACGVKNVIKHVLSESGNNAFTLCF